ncbi:MAG: TIGR03936 family radical SAM-associated protein [Pirellulaceae bacterium]
MADNGMTGIRVRIRFCKGGDLRLLSHRDLLRLLERLFRRAGLELAMSQGFHPKPKMSFPSALALGIVGQREVMELELARDYEMDELLVLLNEQAPSGLVFTELTQLPQARKAQVVKTEYAVEIPSSRREAIEAATGRFLDAPEWLVERQSKKKKNRSRSRGAAEVKTIDLRAGVEKLWLDKDQLRMTLLEIREAGVRPRDVLEALEAVDVERDGATLIRTDVILSVELPGAEDADVPVIAAQTE